MTAPLILIVDDDLGIRELLEDALSFAGFETMTAASGTDALHKVEHRRPTLIVLDVMMPRMDGYHFMQELKRRGIRSTLAVLAISASGTINQHADAIGADGYIAKPFEVDELIGEIERLLVA